MQQLLRLRNQVTPQRRVHTSIKTFFFLLMAATPVNNRKLEYFVVFRSISVGRLTASVESVGSEAPSSLKYFFSIWHFCRPFYLLLALLPELLVFGRALKFVVVDVGTYGGVREYFSLIWCNTQLHINSHFTFLNWINFPPIAKCLFIIFAKRCCWLQFNARWEFFSRSL